MHSELLAAAEPYQWIFAFFVLAPPPQTLSTTFHRISAKYWRFMVFFYATYSLLLLAVAFWITYINNVLAKWLYSTYVLDSITAAIFIAVNILNSLVLLVMQIASFFGYRLLSNILVNIEELEHDIREHCSQQRRVGRECSFRWRLASRVGIWLICLLIFLTYVNYELTYEKYQTILVRILSTFFWLLIQIKCIEYCVIVQLVHELLSLLQHHLQRLGENIITNERHKIMPAECFLLEHSLHVNQRLLARIWNLVNAIECYFSIPMLLVFLTNGVSIIHILNFAYIKSGIDNYNKFRFSYIILVVINMLLPCWISQTCIDMYNFFGAILHNLKSVDSDDRFSLRLREYSLQLMHQKLLFTCGGCFDINLKYFGAMILTITTYVVILIQFKLQAEAERNHSNIIK